MHMPKDIRQFLVNFQRMQKDRKQKPKHSVHMQKDGVQ